MASADQMKASLVGFANDFYDKVVQSQADSLKNVFVSPVSVYTALAMTMTGSGGDTRDELMKALKISAQLTGPTLPDTLGSTLTKYFCGGKGVTVSLANRLFIDKALELKPEFSKEMQTHFKAGQEQVSFESDAEKARQTINKWVSDMTKDRIKELLVKGSVGKETALTIVNALYFKGFWEHMFEKESTEEQDFHKLDGTTMRVKMMYNKDRYPMADFEDMNAQVVKFPFKDSKWYVLVVLPKENDGLSHVISYIRKPGGIEAVLASEFFQIKAEVYLPRFRLGESNPVDAKALLKQMGVIKLFSREADLSRIANDSRLFVNRLEHKAVLEVNEEGAEAAAATAVIACNLSSSIGPVFRMDHPAVVAIISDDNVPVFIGHVTEPEVF